MGSEVGRDDIPHLLDVIRRCGFDEVELTIGDLCLHVRKRAVAAGEHATPPLAAKVPASDPDGSLGRPASWSTGTGAPESGGRRVEVTAPMLGIFYRAPSPGAARFVEAGARVTRGQTLGLIEVMKLFNPLNAQVAGVVTEICADDAQLVEFGQTLMVIEADA